MIDIQEGETTQRNTKMADTSQCIVPEERALEE